MKCLPSFTVQKYSPPWISSGYYHIGLTDAAKLKTAFVTPHGKWHFNMVPFGLVQAPLYFQQLMNQVLQGLDFAIAYLDNIVIFSNNELEYLQHLETLFKRLQDAGLKLKESKCDFFRSQIHYLGHMLSADGIQPLPEKLDSITKMPAPENQTEVKQFLGLVGYYCKFVPCFLDISRPLLKLMRKDTICLDKAVSLGLQHAQRQTLQGPHALLPRWQC